MIVDLLGTLAEAVVTAGKAVGQVVTTIAGKVFDFIKRAILKLLCVFTKKILPALGKAARAVGDFFKAAGRKIWGLIRWVVCKLAKVWGRLVAKFSRKGKTGKQGAGACAIRPPQGGCKTDRQRPSRTRSGRKSKCASCFVAGTMVEAVPFKRAIELLVWDWVKTLLARDRRPLPQPAQPPMGTSHLREVSLRMDRPDGSCTTADLLRTDQWFADQDIFVGNTIYIELPHMSLQGEARVTRINRSPEIRGEKGSRRERGHSTFQQ